MDRRRRPGDAAAAGRVDALRALYKEVDALLAPIGCDRSTTCCRFAANNREPYVTSLEMVVVAKAIGALGGTKAVLGKSKRLPVSGDGRCPLLGDDGGCRIYADRPLGCRTYFCDAATAKPPRAAISGLSARLATLAQAHDPASPTGRPFRSALASLDASA